MKIWTKEEVRKNVADGQKLAEMIGTYDSQHGVIIITVESDDFLPSIYAEMAGKKNIISADDLQYLIDSGQIKKNN
jgi:hypothetical protein